MRGANLILICCWFCLHVFAIGLVLVSSGYVLFWVWVLWFVLVGVCLLLLCFAFGWMIRCCCFVG